MKKRIVLILLLALTLSTRQPSNAQAPASPVVKKIAFEVTNWNGISRQDEIFILDSPNAKPRRLVKGLKPAWSPTGEKLVFCTRTRRASGQVEVINADGSGRMQLTQLRGGACPSDWSTDGERILATAYAQGNPFIVTMSRDGKSITPLAHGYDARWSSDGSRIVFVRDAETRGRHGSIWIADADGKNAKQVIEDDSPVLEASWYPDGKSVAFASARDPKHKAAIFRVNIDGSGLQEIASDKHFSLFFPFVSPDANQLVVDGIQSSDERGTAEFPRADKFVLLFDLHTNRISTLANGLHPSVLWEKH